MPPRKKSSRHLSKRKRLELSESSDDERKQTQTEKQSTAVAHGGEGEPGASQESDLQLIEKSILDKGTVWSYIDNVFHTRFDNLNIEYDAKSVGAGIKKVYVTSDKLTKAFKIAYSDSDPIVPEEYLKKWKSKQDQRGIWEFMNIIRKYGKPLVRGAKSWYHSRGKEATSAVNVMEKDFTELFTEEENGEEMPYQDKKCPSCTQTHDLDGRREVTDECGHKRCATCVFNSKKCPMCRDKASTFPREERKLANSLGYGFQAALCCAMRNSKGRHFVASLLEAAANVCFGENFFNKVLVEAVGTSPVKYDGFPFTKRQHHWMADGQDEKATPRKRVSKSESYVASDIDSSMTPATPSSSKMENSCVDRRTYIYPDVVVKSRIQPDFPRYLLVCEINGKEIEIPFQMYREMVGAGILQNEVFGLSINQHKACILKMTVNPQTGEICFVRRQKFHFAFEMDSDPTFDFEKFHEFFIALIALLDYANANITKAKYKYEL